MAHNTRELADDILLSAIVNHSLRPSKFAVAEVTGCCIYTAGIVMSVILHGSVPAQCLSRKHTAYARRR